MNIPTFNGIVRFKVTRQEPLGKWAQQALRHALETSDSPPESLRFQCRIATDAKTNFANVKLAGGETLTLHPKGHPQFGKNHEGKAYLTVTVIYSGDGQSYRLRWLGNAVPTKMQEVAVKHDMGEGAPAQTIGLDLAAAEVTPSWKANRNGARKNPNAVRNPNLAREQKGKTVSKRCQRNAARLTPADLY